MATIPPTELPPQPESPRPEQPGQPEQAPSELPPVSPDVDFPDSQPGPGGEPVQPTGMTGDFA